MIQTLKNAIIHHINTHIAIVGAGVVGAATGKSFARLGHAVTFCDVDKGKMTALHAEGFDVCPTEELSNRPIDIVLLTVPTPTIEKESSIEFLVAATDTIASSVLKTTQRFVTVIIRSTVLPGTTETRILPLLEQRSGKRVGVDFGLCMNPEFLRTKTSEEDFLHPRGVVLGVTDHRSADILRTLYEPLGAPIHICTPAEAEMIKYASNIFDACKIAFFNEMRGACGSTGIDADRVFPVVREICEACWNPGYGLEDKGPFGGMCFPKDTQAFLSWARTQQHLPMRILGAIIESNDELIRRHPPSAS